MRLVAEAIVVAEVVVIESTLGHHLLGQRTQHVHHFQDQTLLYEHIHKLNLRHGERKAIKTDLLSDTREQRFPRKKFAQSASE